MPSRRTTKAAKAAAAALPRVPEELIDQFAAAHKLARLVYFMLTRGEAFVEQGQQRCEEQRHERSLAALMRRAADLGFQVVPVAPVEE